MKAAIGKFEKLTAELESLGSKVSGLKEQIARIEGELEPAREDVLRLEILEDPSHGPKKKALEAMTAKLGLLRAEQEEAVRRLKVGQGLVDEFRRAALGELKDLHEPRFKAALKAFVAKLEIAVDAEKELRRVRDAAEAEGAKLGAPSPVLPDWLPILLRKTVRGVAGYDPRGWEKSVAKWKELGLLE
jgi:hypothetical protein